MVTVNVHEAKTHLSRLLEQVSAGETVIIAQAGKPIAPVAPRRLGFLAGELTVPDDFDGFGADEIATLFGVADAG